MKKIPPIQLVMIITMTAIVAPHYIENPQTNYQVELQEGVQKQQLCLVKSNEGEPSHLLSKMIEKAERTKSGEDVYFASLLIEKVPPLEQKRLTERLNRIQVTTGYNELELLEEATQQVAIAENTQREKQIQLAQKRVSQLTISQERTELLERIQPLLNRKARV